MGYDSESSSDLPTEHVIIFRCFSPFPVWMLQVYSRAPGHCLEQLGVRERIRAPLLRGKSGDPVTLIFVLPGCEVVLSVLPKLLHDGWHTMLFRETRWEMQGQFL